MPTGGKGGRGIHSRTVVLKLEYASETPGGLTKTQTAGPFPRVSDSGGLGWGLRFILLISSLVRLMLQDWWTTFEKHYSRSQLWRIVSI